MSTANILRTVTRSKKLNAVQLNVCSYYKLATQKERAAWLTPQSDDTFLNKTDAAEFVGASESKINRHKNENKFPRPIPGTRNYIKRHLEFYRIHGPETWFALIGQHQDQDSIFEA